MYFAFIPLVYDYSRGEPMVDNSRVISYICVGSNLLPWILISKYTRHSLVPICTWLALRSQWVHHWRCILSQLWCPFSYQVRCYSLDPKAMFWQSFYDSLSECTYHYLGLSSFVFGFDDLGLSRVIYRRLSVYTNRSWNNIMIWFTASVHHEVLNIRLISNNVATTRPRLVPPHD